MTDDLISRQGAIDICNNVIDMWQGQLGEGALVAIKNAINNLPSVHPTYTDAEIKKMQDMESVEVEKAFDLGREDAKAEIIRCSDCRWQKDQSGTTAWLPCRVLVTPDDFYCGYAERRTNGEIIPE